MATRVSVAQASLKTECSASEVAFSLNRLETTSEQFAEFYSESNLDRLRDTNRVEYLKTISTPMPFFPNFPESLIPKLAERIYRDADENSYLGVHLYSGANDDNSERFIPVLSDPRVGRDELTRCATHPNLTVRLAVAINSNVRRSALKRMGLENTSSVVLARTVIDRLSERGEWEWADDVAEHSRSIPGWSDDMDPRY